ncbi:tubulin nucleotide-binding domain-like protein [Thelephora ganbajun]|uniref:Tubulin nucleotide-binding domain-like protein n=1 Tax=Thelephora ganbajun TaxID=370292 RepID=A0ACB6Z3Y5_THEGA|nr:tubulin nucleotide-binding domain-like protein [Thelephora ganbajun]
MKEILYIQAGTIPNFVGTHFWNAQESYFHYDGDESTSEVDEPEINHDVSFREGLSLKGDPTFCPRLLAFDRKGNFGSSSSFGALYAEDDERTIVADPRWDGSIVEYKQDLVEKSRYHEQLEEELLFSAPSGSEPDPTQPDPSVVDESTVRYWSDYNRVDYHPRSIQKLPDLPDWDLGMGDWMAGKETFDRYNNQDGFSLMDDSVRLFVEECDSLQGLQISSETATFGSFSHSFLSAFRDDFPKLSVLHFQFLAEPVPQSIDLDSPVSRNFSFIRRSYNMLQSSALVSAHIESVTLPMRLKRSSENMSGVLNRLNWRNDTPFVQLSGIFPVESGVPLGDGVIDFSAATRVSDKDVMYSRRDVTRGFSPSEISRYEKWVEGGTRPYGPFESKRALAYPLPTSFPRSIVPPQSLRPRQPKGIFSRSPSTTVLSSLTTTTHTGSLLRGYATFIGSFVKRKLDLESVRAGTEMDEVRELNDGLWTIVDNYGEGGGGGETGEDEGEGDGE